jgi:hypothetical protein
MATPYPDWAGFTIGTAASLLGIRATISLAIKGKSIEGWTPVEGKLDELESGIAKHRGYEETIIKTRYSYTYRGNQYLGRCVSVLDDSPRLWSGPYEDEAIRLREAFKNNTSISLYVNPANPKEAVLLRFSVNPYCLRSIGLFALGVTTIAMSGFTAVNASSALIGIPLGIAAYVLMMSWGHGTLRL